MLALRSTPRFGNFQATFEPSWKEFPFFLRVEPDTLGIFDEGAQASPTPRIRIWLENLWDVAEGDMASFRAEVRTTLLHEIGHVLGWDEEDLEERGLG